MASEMGELLGGSTLLLESLSGASASSESRMSDESSVLITGATSGIGRQLVLDYRRRGWRVVACGRSLPCLQVMQQADPPLEILCFDVTDEKQTQTALSNVDLPSLLILSAGNCEYFNDGQIDVPMLNRLMAVNFFGIAHVLATVAPRLGKDSHCVVIGSLAAWLPFPRAEAYGASKAALSYFCHSLAVDWHSKGILLTLVEPSFVQTPLTEKNDFAMPFCLSVQQASQRIQNGIDKRQAHIVFSRRYRWLFAVLRCLPMSVQRTLMRMSIRKSK